MRLEWRAPACHPERSEGSHALGNEILSEAKDDTGRLIRLASLDEPMMQYVGVNGLALARYATTIPHPLLPHYLEEEETRNCNWSGNKL